MLMESNEFYKISEELKTRMYDVKFSEFMYNLKMNNIKLYKNLYWLLSIQSKLYTSVKLGEERVQIDNGLVDAIIHLNNVGFVTKYSCDGHFKRNPYLVFLGFYKFDMNGVSVKYDLLLHYTILYSIKPIDSNISAIEILKEFNMNLMNLKKAELYKCGVNDIKHLVNDRFQLIIYDYLMGRTDMLDLNKKGIKLLVDLRDEIIANSPIDIKDKLDALLEWNGVKVKSMNLFGED